MNNPENWEDYTFKVSPNKSITRRTLGEYDSREIHPEFTYKYVIRSDLSHHIIVKEKTINFGDSTVREYLEIQNMTDSDPAYFYVYRNGELIKKEDYLG